MKIGFIYLDKTEEEYKQEIKEGQNMELAVSIPYLMDLINVYEIRHPGDAFTQIASIKRDCMVQLGKLKLEGDKHEP
jgi:hypothetical protein